MNLRNGSSLEHSQMRFEIRVQASGGLRTIPEIPDIALCRIEGANGIGKTLAIRLLELCTGGQPFQGQRASWVSLKRNLHAASIKADGLRDGRRIEWEFDPHGWPELPEMVGDWLGKVRIDGAEANIRDASELIRVHRVAGDETMPATLAAQIRLDELMVETWRPRVEERAAILAERLANLAADLRRMDFRAVHDQGEGVASLAAELAGLDRLALAAEERRQRLDAAVEAQRRLERLTDQGPALDECIELAQQTLDALAGNLRDLDERRAALRGEMEREAQTQLEIASVERLLARRRRESSRLDAQLAALITTTDAQRDGDLQGELRRAQDRIGELATERSQIDATPRAAELTEALLQRLAQAVAEGLGDVTVARVADDEISASALADGVTSVRNELLSRPVPANARRLDAELAAKQRLVGRLQQAIVVASRLNNAVARIGQSERQLAALLATIPGDAGQQYRLLSEESSRLSADRAAAALERARLIAEREALSSGETRESLAQLVAEASSDLELEPQRFVDELSQVTAIGSQLEANRTGLLARYQAADADFRACRADLDRALDLFESPEYQWLHESIPDSMPERQLSEETNIERHRRLLIATDRLAGDVAAARSAPAAVIGALQQLATRLDRGSGVSGPLVAGLRRLYELEFRESFARPEIERALFEGGTFGRIDLDRLTVQWASPSGEIRIRPIEALSSGERVFAYTLARIEGLSRIPATNRVIALDEFGAYLAQERFDQLVEYLTQRVLNRIADQILVILPLGRDVGEASGPLPDVPSRERREKAVRTTGYFAESLLP